MVKIVDNICKHPIHPFPARMAPAIVWDNLNTDKRKRLRVLDPMVGSGTSLVIARALGHEAIGFDRDPLALLIAKVWCADVEKDKVRLKARTVVQRAKERCRSLTLGKAYPLNADAETRAFVRYWFDKTNRRQLAVLADAIRRIHDQNTKALLWCGFSRLIITKKIGTSLAMDISHSRPHRVYDKAPIRPFDKFEVAVNTVLRLAPFEKGKQYLPKAQIQGGDARDLPLADNSIDMVITSPPYLNAIDYLRGHKLSLVWMKNSIEKIRNLRSTNIGAEIKEKLPDQQHIAEALEICGDVDALPDRHKGFLIRYIVDMDKVCSEIARVLKPNEKVIYVIGDCTTRGVFVRNSEVIRYLSEHHGLNLLKQEERLLPDNSRYLPPPTNANAGSQLQSRIRKEIILTMQKP